RLRSNSRSATQKRARERRIRGFPHGFCAAEWSGLGTPRGCDRYSRWVVARHRRRIEFDLAGQLYGQVAQAARQGGRWSRPRRRPSVEEGSLEVRRIYPSSCINSSRKLFGLNRLLDPALRPSRRFARSVRKALTVHEESVSYVRLYFAALQIKFRTMRAEVPSQARKVAVCLKRSASATPPTGEERMKTIRDTNGKRRSAKKLPGEIT